MNSQHIIPIEQSHIKSYIRKNFPSYILDYFKVFWPFKNPQLLKCQTCLFASIKKKYPNVKISELYICFTTYTKIKQIS